MLARTVNPSQELIVISQEGIVLRTSVESIRQTGRAAEGVSVINLAPGDAVASLAIIEMAQPQEAATAEGPQPSSPLETEADEEKKTKAPMKAAAKPQARAPRKAAAKPQAKAATKAVAKPRALAKATAASKTKASSVTARGASALAKAEAALGKAKAALGRARPDAQRRAAPKDGAARREQRGSGRRNA